MQSPTYFALPFDVPQKRSVYKYKDLTYRISYLRASSDLEPNVILIMDELAGTTSIITIVCTQSIANTTWRSNASTLPVRTDTATETNFEDVPDDFLVVFLRRILILYVKLRKGYIGEEIISDQCPESNDWRGNCELVLLDIAEDERTQPRLLALAIFHLLKQHQIRTLNVGSLRHLILHAFIREDDLELDLAGEGSRESMHISHS